MNHTNVGREEIRRLEIVRTAYAKQVCAAAQVHDSAVIAAFASVQREHFLGSGPWPILRGGKYVWTPDDDPIYLYTNDIVGIRPEARLNNGQPSLHALLISAAHPKSGDKIVHIGAGTGYYTAILAALAGPFGRVTAIELDDGLAESARSNLVSYKNVQVNAADGTTFGITDADVVYVNAGATRPLSIWLDGLADGGRLILPLTTTKNFEQGPRLSALQGAVFCVERRGNRYPARWVSNVGIIPCEGAREELSENALMQAFIKGNGSSVGGLVRSGDVPAEQCWLHAPDWCLVLEKYWSAA